MSPKSKPKALVWFYLIELFAVIVTVVVTRQMIASMKREERQKEFILKNEKRLQAIYDNSKAGVIIYDYEGNHVFVNKRTCEISGYSREELLGQPFDLGLHPEDVPLAHELLYELQKGKISNFDGELRFGQ